MSNPPPRILAVVPTVGHSPWLARCLAALRGQGEEGTELTVVLVRQGSRPVPGETRAHRVLTLPAPVGFARATNHGVRQGLAGLEDAVDYVATVNDDLVVETGWARALADALDSHPGAAAAQGVNLQGTELGAPLLTDGRGLAWNGPWQAVQLGRDEPPPGVEEPSREVFGVSATAALYRLADLRRLESWPRMFDQRLDSYYEDVDLACRLRRAGRGALSVPAARAVHAGSLTGGRAPVSRWRLIYGNRWLVVARLLGARFPGQVPRLLGRDLADLARALGRGDLRRGLGIPAGWSRALAHLPGFAHRGEPLVAPGELERFRISSRG